MKLFSIFIVIISFQSDLVAQTFPGLYHSEDGFCSTSIFVQNNGFVFKETGCEGRSRVSFGKWTSNNDTLVIHPWQDIRIFNPVDSVGLARKDSGTTRISVFDALGKNITSGQILVINLANGEQSFELSQMEVDVGKFKEPSKYKDIFFSNEEVILKGMEVESIELKKLNLLFDYSEKIGTKGNSDIIVYLNVPGLILWAPEINKIDFYESKWNVDDLGLYRDGELVLQRK